jgi:hypothetical protein
MNTTHAPSALSTIWSRLVRVAAAVLCVLGGSHASAQTSEERDPRLSSVEIAPFAGLQFGGAIFAADGRKVSLGAGLDYGGTVDVRIAESWSIEALYSRQSTELPGPFEAAIERYMAGLVEEQDYGRTKFFGVALFGATRYVPGASGYGSQAVFTIGLGLGVKHFLSDRFALRADARGFYAITEAGGGLFCSGGCLFTFSGSGFVQGDLTAGVAVAF